MIFNKQFLFLPVAVMMAILFGGCPVSTSYPLSEKKSEKIIPELVGTWANDSINAEAQKVTLKKTDDYSYSLTVQTKGSMYMAETTVFDAWITTIDNQKFIVLQETDNGTPKETYYVYHIALNKKELTTHDITLKVGGTDAVTSVNAYRDEVKASMPKADFLAGKIVWKKK